MAERAPRQVVKLDFRRGAALRRGAGLSVPVGTGQTVPTGAGSSSSLTAWLGVAWTTLGVSAFVLVCTWWRESPQFWLNAGGYPLWLRAGVRVGYYPLLALNGLGVAWLFASLIRRPPAFLWQFRTQALWLAALSVLTGISVALALANNINNFIAHRPLHWHEERPVSGR